VSLAAERLVALPETFAFAGIRFVVEGRPGRASLRVPRCVGAPVSPDVPAPLAATVHLELHEELREVSGRSPGPRARHFAVERSVEGLRIDRGGEQVLLRRGAEGRYAAKVPFAPDASGLAELDLLQSVAAAVLSDVGGGVMHAAAVILDGRACLYVGPSDAGKSTACAHTDGPLLAIDRVALVPADGHLWAWAMPGGPEDEHPGSRAASTAAPLGWVLRVVQAHDRVRVRLLPPAAAAMVIRAALLWPMKGAPEEERAMDLVARVAAGVPVGEIHTVLGQPNAGPVRALPGLGP
jgi:hypothetical protein